ncbi:hypothetical protein TNCV_1443691 [Trichonephila clavipes]|nr:hypothetical protein TNCV_1443691 [Trichonephila clavipes]
MTTIAKWSRSRTCGPVIGSSPSNTEEPCVEMMPVQSVKGLNRMWKFGQLRCRLNHLTETQMIFNNLRVASKCDKKKHYIGGLHSVLF